MSDNDRHHANRGPSYFVVCLPESGTGQADGRGRIEKALDPHLIRHVKLRKSAVIDKLGRDVCLARHFREHRLLDHVLRIRVAHGDQVCTILHPLHLKGLVVANMVLNTIGEICHHTDLDAHWHGVKCDDAAEDIHHVSAHKDWSHVIAVGLELHLVLGMIVVDKFSGLDTAEELSEDGSKLTLRGNAWHLVLAPIAWNDLGA